MTESRKVAPSLLSAAATQNCSYRVFVVARRRALQRRNMATYHTNSKEYPPKNREVHHNNEQCPEGKKIKTEHRESGTGGKPLCKEC